MVFASLFTTSVSAERSTDSATSTYSYWLGYNEKTLAYSKPIYETEKVLYGFDFGYSDFSKPSDIYCDDYGKLYIVESGSSRLTVIDSEYKVQSSITKFVDAYGNEYEFFGAGGVFVDKKNTIYIADTMNARILIGDINGNLIKEMGLPESSLIPEDFIYQPTKVVVDNKGFMYVISSGSTYGALLFTPEGEFQGFYGANTVTNDITSALKNLWSNFFATDEQLQGQVQKIPFQFTDICLDVDDFVYTITGATDLTDLEQTGQIRCLNPKGQNILDVKETEKYTDSDSFNFGDTEVANQAIGSGYRLQNFVSVEVDSEGFIYALDSTYGRIFVYDKECNLLSAFGGGTGDGENRGTFVTANSIAVYNGKIFVSDNTKNSITVFTVNEYGKLLRNADILYLNGKYAESKDYWLSVNKYDPNCQLAYHGLAKVYLIEKDYDKALYYAKAGLDYSTYNQAFTNVRNEKLQGAFKISLLVVIILVILLVGFLILKRKKNWQFKVNTKIKVCCTSFIHPFEAANQIKFHNQGSIIIATVLLALFYVFKVLGVTNGGFMFSKFDPQTYNSVYTLLGSVGLVLLWTICYWAVAVLFSGKCKLKEVFIISSYAMIPQIINGIFYLIASNILVFEEGVAMSAVSTVMLILSGIVLCIGCMICSEYSFFKFAGVAVITVLAMCLVVFVIFMVLTLDQQLLSFIQSIFKEVIYR